MRHKRKGQAREISDEDARLFRESIGDIRPLAPKPESGHTRAPPAPHPAMFERDEAAVRDELLDSAIDPAAHEVGEELLYLREGHSPQLLKRLRRGTFSIQDEIDLHQMDERTARATLGDFLADASRRGIACVRIVHGKGLRSGSAGPVLKRMTDRVLRRRDDVLAFASARPAQGGTGATVVLLRAVRRRG
ncbi:MAG TPA: Smr/MutS family protein [Rhodanobacteraceae bacterium]|nr:Smr/MutS family protein [Rhodanobacteraceae bacterium]